MGFRRMVLACAVFACSLAGCVSVAAPVALAATPPVIEEESVMEAAATSATLQTTINPEGSETTYRFEYGTSEAYGSSIPVPDGIVGAGSTGVTVSVHIQGLAANTGYHYRVVAGVPSRGESVDGADGAFTTQRPGSAFSLPDGRQWELVSPPNKHGAPIFSLGYGVMEAAEDGDAISYLTEGPTELEPQGYAFGVQVFSKRGAQGWSSKDIATPHNEETGAPVGTGLEYRYFSADLSSGIVEPFGPFTKIAPEETARTPDIRHDFTCEATPASCYTPLVTAANVPSGAVLGTAKFVDATPDASHVILSGVGGLSEWAEGQLQKVSVYPEAEGGGPIDGEIGDSEFTGGARHAVSNDGSRVFWTGTSVSGTERPLYLRDTLKRETLRIGTDEYPVFESANSDGSKVFFRKSYFAGAPLEECNVVEIGGKLACDMTQLAPEIEGAMTGSSEDGSYVYFASDLSLAAGAVSGTCKAGNHSVNEQCNLYVIHDNGTSWEAPKLVAVLSAADYSDFASQPSQLMARVSPNGMWLAFMSQRSLTDYDNRDVASGKPDEELYLYDAETGKVVCASCDPTGARPAGVEYENFEHSIVAGKNQEGQEHTTSFAANIHGWEGYNISIALYQPRYLSDSGRLFFDTPDALVPQDVNGTWDVYEFEPATVGGCTVSSATFEVATGGCAGLISEGTSPEDSAFMEASASGDDVFFLTTSHLTSEDFDTARDIYDAHACSPAAPCYTPPVVPPPCSTGDGCKAPPSPQPTAFGAPSSATFSGAGNVSVSPQSTGSTAKSKSLTRAQKLTRALKACRKESRKKRAGCERQARGKYGAKSSNKSKAGAKKSDRGGK